MSLMSKSDTAAVRLAKVRAYMQTYSMDAFIVFSGDAHKSEYTADYDKRRSFLSDFHGSSGTAVVTQTQAALWTDGRYFSQASSELTESWTLMKSGQPGVPEPAAWLCSQLCAGQTVGVDPRLVPAREAKDLQTQLGSSSITLVGLSSSQPNPVDMVWDQEATASGMARPSPPRGPACPHPLQFSGVSHLQKLADLQRLLGEKGADVGVISALDEIAWLFNVRGSDVTFNPVVQAYAVVLSAERAREGGSVFLFIDAGKVTEEVSAHLLSGNASGGGVNVVLRPYTDIASFLSSLLSRAMATGSSAEGPGGATSWKVLLDASNLNWEVHQAVAGAPGVQVLDTPSVVGACKTIKNSVEMQGIRASHVRDGVALTAFLAWLDSYMAACTPVSPCTLTEHEAAVKLETFRAAMPLHVSPSFKTISAYGGNGAVIHYRPPEEGSAVLGYSSLYLLDSGAQYLDGTTDVTRTLYFGPAASDVDESTPEGALFAAKIREMRDAFTYVLQAHIALAVAKFPENTLGYRLDAITRAPLWAVGLDYAHGTGHGVGAYLNVHEGPQGIGTRPRLGDMGFQAGMTSSNEPGFYKDGDYGIRIENVCIAVDADRASFSSAGAGAGAGKFLEFDTVTMCPLDRRLINTALLSPAEVSWVNCYHARVRAALEVPMAEAFPEAVQYLLLNTEPL